MLLILTTFNRYDILKKSLESLFKTNFIEPTKLFISDDNSTDARVYLLLKNLPLIKNLEIEVNLNDKNLGCDRHITKTIERVFNQEKDEWLMVLDSDLIYNPGWQEFLIESLKTFSGPIGLTTLFNCEVFPGVEYNENYLEKQEVGGVAALINRKVFDKIKKSPLKSLTWDSNFCHYSRMMKYKIICSKNSYVQHIGVEGVHSQPGNCQTGVNFLGE